MDVLEQLSNKNRKIFEKSMVLENEAKHSYRSAT